MPDTHWPDYYAVTVDRPAWGTTVDAAERFAAEDAAREPGWADAADGTGPTGDVLETDAAEGPGRADDAGSPRRGGGLPRLAVDLGCGAGRDTRELLRRGWRVLAVDREGAAIEAVVAATPEDDRARLESVVADLATVELPACDLVLASVSLQFLTPAEHAAAFERITAALRPGGRFAGLLYGDRDEAASDPAYTCPSPDAIRGYLAAFDIESWFEREEDGKMALGDPHHIHLIEVVARRR